MDDVSLLLTFPLVAANMMLVGAVLLCGLVPGHVFAFLLITLLFGFVHLEYKADWTRIVSHPLYLIAGSCVLGYAAFLLARLLALLIRRTAALSPG